jgi:hypothetical protein
MAKKKESIKTWKTAKTSKEFNKAVKKFGKSGLMPNLADVMSNNPTMKNAKRFIGQKIKTSKMQKRDKDLCVKSGGDWVKGACKAKSKFKAGTGKQRAAYNTQGRIKR